jgi:hypothetical protein
LPEDISLAMPVGMPDADIVSKMQYSGYTIWYMPIPSLPSIAHKGIRYIAPNTLEINPPSEIIIAPFINDCLNLDIKNPAL